MRQPKLLLHLEEAFSHFNKLRVAAQKDSATCDYETWFEDYISLQTVLKASLMNAVLNARQEGYTWREMAEKLYVAESTLRSWQPK